jgi:CspA family cold shock protein
MITGKVKWFNTEKGYGFIQQDNSDSDVFLHAKVLETAGISHIRDGQAVQFEISTDQKGRAAASSIELL